MSGKHIAKRLLIILIAFASGGLVACVILQILPQDMAIGRLIIRTQRGVDYPMVAIDDMAKVAAGRALELPKTTFETDDTEPARPRNIIVLLGDGMGLGQLSTTSQLLFGARGGLSVERIRSVGLSRSWATNNLRPDSAASGTAIATGFHTSNAMVGVLPDGRPVRNLFEAARARGLATGILTTSYLMDATPACFAAHAPSRKQYATILDQMLNSGAEVMLGGDSKVFGQASDDPAMHAVVDRLRRADELGYTVIYSANELAAAKGKLIGLFPSRDGSDSAHGPPLAESTSKLLSLLDQYEGGFAALIESEITDHAGHCNDIATLVDAMREFDEAVALVLDFAEGRGDTLVLVLADHATGAPAIVSAKTDSGKAIIRWATSDHTAHWIPVFAYGPGAERFSGVFDHTQIGPTLGELMDFKDYPAIIERDH